MKARVLAAIAALTLMLVACMDATSGGPTTTPPSNGRPTASQGQSCGGLVGVQCNSGLYCNYAPSAQCGAADQTGACAVRPQACTRDYRPVCGCDGHTYSNACTAAAAGVSVVSQGECAPHGSN